MSQRISGRSALCCLILSLAWIALACKKAPDKLDDPLEVLRPFLDRTLHEFVEESGSPKERWEAPYVTQELILLIEMDIARGRAFVEGLETDRKDPPILRPPTPWSYWLPIPVEGWYSYEIEKTRHISRTHVQVVVRFHNHYDIKDEKTGKITTKSSPDTYEDQLVCYDMTRFAGDWLVSNVREEYGIFDLKKYLRRPDYMKDYTDYGGQ